MPPPAANSPATDQRLALLRLTLIPGLGPILIRRLIEYFGSPAAAITATPAQLAQVKRIGDEKARAIAAALRDGQRALDEELELAARLSVRIVTFLDNDYPPLLRPIENAPPLLYIRGSLDPAQDRYCLAIVGSRSCTSYGLEQTERFALHLAQAGVPIVSGGARGIDSAAHRGALRARGRTIAILGCGLAHCYPPENANLFAQIEKDGGAVISELPLNTSPAPDNFPARNRIISAMSLGILVVEAGRGSGALITARLAAEEHGREVMAIPGRIDSAASEGSLELLKQGGAAIVTDPADVLDILERPARHAHSGAHADLFSRSVFETPSPAEPAPAIAAADTPPTPEHVLSLRNLTVSQRTLVEALVEPKTVDELARQTGLDAGVIRADATILELRRVIVNRGGAFALRSATR